MSKLSPQVRWSLTIKVVRADVMSCLLPGPEWGLSSSVMRNIRFEAVLGALEEVAEYMSQVSILVARFC
jgi:hypothetical protein